MSVDQGTPKRWTPRNVPLWFVFTLLVVAGGGMVWKRALDGGDGGGLHPANATEAADDGEVGEVMADSNARVRPSPQAGGGYGAGGRPRPGRRRPPRPRRPRRRPPRPWRRSLPRPPPSRRWS